MALGYSASQSRISSQPAGPVDGDVGLLGDLRRPLGGEDADPDRGDQLARLAQLAEPAEGVDVGAVVARVDDPVEAVAGEQRGDRGVLAAAADRPQLQHLAPPARVEPGPAGVDRDLPRRRLGRAPRRGAAPVERLDRPLVLEPQPGVGRGAPARARR